MEDPRRREIALFRYALIREAADPELAPAERGRLVRALAAREHRAPDGRWVRLSRPTLDRWIRAWRAGGFEGLVPRPRPRTPRSDRELLERAVQLKREHRGRTAAHIHELLRTELAARGEERSVPALRTLQRHFARLDLHAPPEEPGRQAYGRFEAARPNDRWQGDGMHGPRIAGGRAILVAFIDDHSRLVPGHHWGRAEDSVRLEAALRRGLAARGVPRQVYVDNGSPWVAAPLHRACAVLGIRLVHSRPGRPEGRGKIERFFRTVRSQFLVELEAQGSGGLTLERLQVLFTAWLEQRYHRRVHSETGESPLARFTAGGLPESPGPELLREAFLWSALRQVSRTATVSLHGNRYEVDPELAGRRVELLFDPFDLEVIEVRWNGASFGRAAPHELTTHVHPQVRGRRDHPEAPPPASGIDYLALIEQEHRQATRRAIHFADLDPAAWSNDHDHEEDPA